MQIDQGLPEGTGRLRPIRRGKPLYQYFDLHLWVKLQVDQVQQARRRVMERGHRGIVEDGLELHTR